MGSIMSIFYLKLFIGATIFLMALLCGLLPMMLAERKHTFLFYGESFAGGVLLGAGFLHLLADSLHHFAKLDVPIDYTYVMAVAAFTIFSLRFVEDGLSGFFHSKQVATKSWVAYLLVLLLSIHSVIAGAAIGISQSWLDVMVIGMAIFAHKGAAAFAMVVNMQRHQLSRGMMWRLLILFSFMTPLGMAIAGSTIPWLDSSTGQILEANFEAIAAGTFIYIATQYTCERIPCGHTLSHLTHLIMFAIGLLLMTIVAMWI